MMSKEGGSLPHDESSLKIERLERGEWLWQVGISGRQYCY